MESHRIGSRRMGLELELELELELVDQMDEVTENDGSIYRSIVHT